jgi:chromate transport protein ChrA
MYFRLSLLGAQVGSATILFTHFLRQFNHNCADNPIFCLVLVGFTCVFLLYSPSESSLNIAIVLVLLLTMYVKKWDRKPISQLQRSILNDLRKHSAFFGYFSIYLLLMVVALVWASCSLLDSPLLTHAWSYLVVGLLVYGSGHSLIGISFLHLYSKFSQPYVFWLAVPCCILMPGLTSPFLVSYYGFTEGGLAGSAVALGCYYLPIMLIIFGLMPKWSTLHSTMAVQRMAVGMTCLNLGLLLFGLLQMLASTHREGMLSFLIFVIGFVVHYMYEVSNWKTILFSILLANIRRWGMIYYRKAEFTLDY